MEAIESVYEKKIDALLSKMFGDASSELKAVTKISLMNNVLTDEMKENLKVMRDKAFAEAQMVYEEMTMTLDSSGNVVPIEGSASPPQEESPRQKDMKEIYHDN
jgi:hypothetical protein